MNKAIEVCQRNELWALLKKIDAYHGGNDIEWLKIYAKEVLKGYSLDVALTCFRDIAKSIPDKKIDKIAVCEFNKPHIRQLQPPFIENV